MNEVRVRRLATEGKVEITRKMLKRLTRRDKRVSDLVRTLAQSELKKEDVLAYPDYTFSMGIVPKEREYDLVCVQTPDGQAVRIVGFIDKHPVQGG